MVGNADKAKLSFFTVFRIDDMEVPGKDGSRHIEDSALSLVVQLPGVIDIIPFTLVPPDVIPHVTVLVLNKADPHVLGSIPVKITSYNYVYTLHITVAACTLSTEW